MKRKITKLMAALALLVAFALPATGWGQNSAVLPNTQALTTEFVNVGEDVNIQIKTSSANTYTIPLRFYANVTATIQALDGFKILSVTYEASSTGNYVTYAQNATVTPAVTPTVSGKNVTWDYSSNTDDVTEYTFTPSSQTRCNSITIVYTTTGGSVTPTCATPTFTPAAGTYTEAQNVTIACATEGATIHYTTDGTEPTNESAIYSAALTISETTTVKAIAVKADYNNSAVATAAYTIVTIEHAGTEADPYTVADARTAIDANTGVTGVYATGIVSQIVTAYSSQYGNISYNISVDGTTTADQLQAYRGKSYNGENFTSEDDIQVGDIVVIYGNLTKYNATYEFAADNQLVSLVRPQNPSITIDPDEANFPATITGYEAAILALSYNNIEIADIDSFTVQFYDNENNEITKPDWVVLANVAGEVPDGIQVICLPYHNEGEARTAYFRVRYGEVYSNLVTVNQAGAVVPSITVSPDHFEFDANLHMIEVLTTLAYENIEIVIGGIGHDNFGIQYYDADGQVIEHSWCTVGVSAVQGSDDFQLALVTLQANNGNEARTAYFKVYGHDAEDNVVYSNLVTLTQAAPVVDYAVLPFEWEGGASADFDALNGTTLSGNGNDYANTNAPYLIKLDSDGDYIMVKTDSQPGKVTIGVKMIGGNVTSTITVQGSADGETFTDIETLTISGDQNEELTLETTNAFGANDRYVRLLFTKGSNVGVGPITIETGNTPSITVTPATIDLEAVGQAGGTGYQMASFTFTYHNLTITQDSDFAVQFYDADGEELAERPAWIGSLYVTPVGNDYSVLLFIEANTGVARSAYFKVYASDANDDVVYSNLVTVNQAGAVVPSITVSPDTFVLDANPHMGDVLTTLAYENIEIVSGSGYDSFGIQYYDADGQEIEDSWCSIYVSAVQNSDDFQLVTMLLQAYDGNEARTAYFKVYGHDADNNVVYSNLVTITQNAPVVDYAVLPFVWEGGAKADFLAQNGVTANGLGSDYASGNAPYLIKLDNTGDYIQVKCDQQPGKVTIGVKMIGGANTSTITVQGSADGETFTDIETLTISGAQNDVLTLETTNVFADADRYVRLLFTKGSNVGVGPITIETGNAPSITVTPATVDLEAVGEAGGSTYQMQSLSVTYHNLDITQASDFAIQFYDAEGQEQEQPSWFVNAVVAGYNAYMVMLIIEENTGDARSAYFKVYASDANDNVVYSNLVTINQAAAPFEGATYTLATSIESGRHYIVVGFNDDDTYAMGTQNNNNRPAVAININEEGKAEVESADVYEFVINGPDANGYYTIYDATTPGYLYAASSSSNYLKTRDFNTSGDSQWAITFGEENEAGIIAQGENTRNIMRYNKSSNLFACYASGQQSIYLYVKDDETEYEFFTDITGYGNSDGGYYLIASPVDDVNPESVNHMLDNNYDLYAFDQAEAEEWRNYKTNAFNLASGAGYLYANSNGITLGFAGTPYSGNGEITLTYDENAGFAGWNLVGNPFGQVAYIERDYYTMNEDGDELITGEGNAIAAMQGIFVVAESDNETMTFSTTNPADNDAKLVVNVCSNRGSVIDRAIVRFDNGAMLPKFQLNPNNTKIYFPVDGADFAVATTSYIGEMPLNFSAAADGNYTLTFAAENMEIDYLHLVDHVTGMDIDLLQTTDYSFEASEDDNAARFTLVFANLTGIEENSAEQFAFFSNGNLIVNNEGNATLQVIDVMGRVLSSETLNGCANVSVNAAPGVYMLRLVNGDNVKTQKVVVE